MINLQYFCIFMYIWWLLTFLGCFFCGKLTKPCRHARTFQLVSQKSLESINNKNPKIFTKRPLVATTVPSGTQRHHWGIGSLPNPVVMPEFSIWSARKAWQVLTTKTPKILTKRPPVATTVPSGTQRHYWGIGIPGYTNILIYKLLVYFQMVNKRKKLTEYQLQWRK